MVREFADKDEWAVVLGGSSGLGLATAKKLAAHGLNLCLVYRVRRSETIALESTFEAIEREHKIQLIHYNVDAINPEKRSQVLEGLVDKVRQKGKVKVLIHSIAKGNLKPMISEDSKELGNDDLRLTIESMAISLYDWTKDIFLRQLFSNDARIISFTSEGNKKAWKNYAAVSAAKVALEAITRSIALEFASHGIKANCVQAGITDTASLRMIPGNETLKAQALQKNPSGRLTTPKDVADVVYLLTKAEAKWITGAIIPADGGEHLN